MKLCQRCGFEKGGVLDECIDIGSMRVTHAEAARAGLLPEQERARAVRSLKTLEQYGLGDTTLAHALRKVAP